MPTEIEWLNIKLANIKETQMTLKFQIKDIEYSLKELKRKP